MDGIHHVKEICDSSGPPGWAVELREKRRKQDKDTLHILNTRLLM